MWKDVGYLCGWKNPGAPRMTLPVGDGRVRNQSGAVLPSEKGRLSKWSLSHPGKKRKGKKVLRGGGDEVEEEERGL